MTPRNAYRNASTWLLLESKTMHSMPGCNVNFCMEVPIVSDSSGKLLMYIKARHNHPYQSAVMHMILHFGFVAALHVCSF